jgi:radical SAM protein with 4Fe4S-binding SPASM domain
VLCSVDTAAGKAHLDQLAQHAAASHIPLFGAAELTERCNLRCAHCYLGSYRERPAHAELPTRELLRVFDEAVDAGCLFMLLTGGEPLVRADFADIYRHLRERGVMVTVFTNGTLVDEEHCALFSDLPPRAVEVSVYGASASTYESVTRAPGSFSDCLRGVDRLLEAGVTVRLKTMLLTANRHELDALRALASSYGVPFRFDATVSAALDGDLSPLKLRLPAAEAVAAELSDDSHLAQWRRHYGRLKEGPAPEGLYGCGAGVSSFFLDAHGVLFPCLMARSVSHDAARKGFQYGWTEVMPKIRGLAAGGMVTCNRCEARAVCDACPGLVALETGAEDGRSDYVCAVGRARERGLRRLPRSGRPRDGRGGRSF